MTRKVAGLLGVLLAVDAQAQSIRLSATHDGPASVEVIQQSASGTTFEVTIPEINVIQVKAGGKAYDRLSLPGGQCARLEEGKPEVPQVAVLLAVPTGAQVTARVLQQETEVFAVGRVYPQQPVPRVGDGPGALVVDEQSYRIDAYYPGMSFDVANPARWRDLSVLSVRVYPVRVNPARGTIEVATRIRVRVDYAGGAYPRATTDWMATLYSRLVANFGLLHLRTCSDSPTGWDYLAIIHNKYDSCQNLGTYLDQVEQRGYRVRRMTVQDSITDVALKDSIRAV